MRLDLPREIRVSVSGRTMRVPFEDYVLGAALSEVSPVGESAATVARIFEVQTVLARTYALAHLGPPRDRRLRPVRRHALSALSAGAHNDVALRASRATGRGADGRRVCSTFGGRPADALYHSDCGGHTASAATAWGGAPVPYLV